MARIGVEPAHNGYKAKNTLDSIVTPDAKAWHPVAQDPAAAQPAEPAKHASTPAKINRPDWAS